MLVNTRRVVSVLSVIVLLAIAAGIFVLAAAPRLEGVSPADGAEAIPSRASLRMTFSRTMEPETVIGNLAIYPEQDGIFTWDDNTLIFTPDQPWPSGEEVNVQLDGGKSTLGLSMLRGETWSFTIGLPRIAYLWPADGRADVYALDPVSGAVDRLTTTSYGVLDFSLNFEGTRLLYSAVREDGGGNLMQLDLLEGGTTTLLECPQETCRSPQLSPDGGLLAYVRIPPVGGETQVWLVSLPDGEPIPAGEAGHETGLPAWSSTGLLAFYDREAQAFVILDPETGETTALPNEIGEPGSWSPEGERFVYPELLEARLEGVATFSGHLIHYDVVQGITTDLTQDNSLEDTAPVFSPGGNLIALARKSLDADEWTLGSQLWLMQSDGSGAMALTAAPEFHHTAFAWKPTGDLLAYVRFNQAILTEPPELWLIRVDGGNPIRLVIGGYAPLWIP